MAKNAHLTLDDRATIEISLREGKSFTEIGKELGKDPSTISKKLRTIVNQSVKGVIIPAPREPAVHIWVKPVDLTSTHIMARVKAAHTEIVMSIALTLLNCSVRNLRNLRMFATAAIHAFVVNLSVIFTMPRRLKRNTN